MTAAFATPIKTTMVSAAGIDAGPPLIEWPVTIATDVACPLAVRGIPAQAGTASAEETPGTISKGMPAASSSSASSAPRPKSSGSPPLSRTTR